MSPMTSRQRYSSFNCRARGQTEYNLERNTSRSSSKASHSNNVCWIVSDSRDSQQGHCALRTSCVRLLELRRSWQPNRNFVFNLRPSRRDEGQFLMARAWAAPGHMTRYLPWRTCTYPEAQRAACAHPLARRGLSLIALNGFSRKPVG